MDVKKEVNRVVSELKSAGTDRTNCSGSLYGALIMMRTTLIKSKQALIQLVEAGCVRLLLDLLVPPMEKGNWLKTVDIVISILANMCLEEEARDQVISNNGMCIIAEATVSSVKESIHNRGVRAVANLVQHSLNSDDIFELEFPAFVAKRLMDTKEKECKQTYLRAIRLFGQRKSQLIKLIEDSRCVQAVASLLKEEDEKLKYKSLKLLHEFSDSRCCPNFVEQIITANISEVLVKAVEDPDDEISFLSLSFTFKLCEHENIRPPLCAAGLITTLMRLLDCDRGLVNHISVMNALCLCSREAVNRHRLYQENTLELFIKALHPEQLYDSGKFSVLHDRMISCLINFLYNDECFAKLLDLGLVPILISHLKRVCKVQVPEENWCKEVKTILDEKNNGAKDSTMMETDDDDKFEDGVALNNQDVCNDQNVDKTLQASTDHSGLPSPSNLGNAGLSASIDTTAEENEVMNVEGSKESSEILSPCDNLDQEIVDITMEDTEIIPPSGSIDSRHVFSIDSPTYQMEQHSWRLEDHTSGITCKDYTAVDLLPENPTLPKSGADGGGGKFSPYSPLSAGASYYSPAYPSPAHSFGSSPKHPSFQGTSNSFNLGLQSPQSSPAWSPASSLHSEDTWSSSDQGRSPGNLIHSAIPHQGQFSPLINPYPASPPPRIANEDREIYDSLIPNSQASNMSNRTLDNTDDIILPESPNVLFQPETSQQCSGKFSSLLAILKRNDKNLIYSASEDDDEEVEGQGIGKFTDQNKSIEERKKNFEKEEEEEENDEKYLKAKTKATTKLEGRRTSKRLNTDTKSATTSIKSFSLQIDDENTTFPHLPSTSTNVPLVRLNSEPCVSLTMAKNDNEQCDHLEQEVRISDAQPCKKVKHSEKNPSVQLSIEENNVKSGKKLFTKHFSFPIKSTLHPILQKIIPSHSPSSSSSPFRVQSDLLPNSPSMSPFSRYSISPYSSPNPYQPHAAEKLSLQNEIFYEGPTKKSDSKSPEKIANPLHKMRSPSQLSQTSSDTTICKEHSSSSDRLNTVGENLIPNQPSTSESAKDEDSERVKKIKKTTESNILILLSRISVKTNPMPFLVKFSVLSTLTSYLSISPKPFQRCIRTLLRVCNNPLCFESLMLEQAPALIVKNLILDQDGTFPSVLFKDFHDDRQCNTYSNNRKMNFDEFFASSQSSDTASDFGLKMEFEFGGDAYSRMISSSASHFPPSLLNRSLSVDSQCARDNPEIFTAENSSDGNRIKSRIRNGINLMRAIASVALSRYGDGEIQRIWSRGTESEKLMCAISLLHMPMGCGPLHRHQLVFKRDSLSEVLPLLFCKESPVVRESIVTALSLLAYLFGITKATPKISKLNPCENGKAELKSSDAKNVSGINKDALEDKVKTEEIACIYELVSDKYNLNFTVEDDKSHESKVFRACKEILMEKSDVFSAMLGGGYVEAEKVDIEFSDVSLFGFEYIMHYLHGCESGCAVIDSLTLTHCVNLKPVNNCDNAEKLNVDNCNGFKNEEPVLIAEEKSNLTLLPRQSAILDGEADLNHCDNKPQANPPENSSFENIIDLNDISHENERDKNYLSSSQNKETQPKQMGDSTSSSSVTTKIKQTNSDTTLSDKPSTSSSKETNNNDDQLTKHIDSMLDKCIDILTVADRFLLHDLVQYLTSVLSHTCLYTRTSQNIFYLASTYKLTCLASDSVLEVLLSSTSRKDVALFFLNLGLDSEMKKTLLNSLRSLLTKDEKYS